MDWPFFFLVRLLRSQHSVSQRRESERQRKPLQFISGITLRGLNTTKYCSVWRKNIDGGGTRCFYSAERNTSIKLSSPNVLVHHSAPSVFKMSLGVFVTFIGLRFDLLNVCNSFRIDLSILETRKVCANRRHMMSKFHRHIALVLDYRYEVFREHFCRRRYFFHAAGLKINYLQKVASDILEQRQVFLSSKSH